MSLILKTIWQKQPISRVELVELTGLTSGTITNLTLELIQGGLIRESETTSGTVGRRRVMLRFDTDKWRMIGIDIGRSSYEVVMTDLSGRVLQTFEGGTEGISDPQRVMAMIRPHVDVLRRTATNHGGKLLGIGISIPGPMDIAAGKLLNPPNFPGWEGFPIRSAMERMFGLPVFMEDDARSSALAERWFGLGREGSDLVFVTIGIGIGGGVITGGEIVRGTNGLYGQVGHITVVPDGELCECGNKGCWETVGSIPGIMRAWAKKAARQERSGESEMSPISAAVPSAKPDGSRQAGKAGEHRGNEAAQAASAARSAGDGRTLETFFAAVRRREDAAADCMNDTLDTMVSSLTNLFHLYDPDLIVLGGKLLALMDDYLPQIAAGVKSRVFAFARDRVHLATSTFGGSQSAVGAAALVFDALLKEPLAMAQL